MSKFSSSFLEVIDRRIKNALLSTEKTISGTALTGEKADGTVSVDISGQKITVFNKSGEYVTTGDTVYITYKTNISQGHISRRAGAYKANGRLSVTQAEFDSMQTAGELIEGWVYDIIG